MLSSWHALHRGDQQVPAELDDPITRIRLDLSGPG